MDTILRASADELNNSLIDFIKASFKGKRIAVHIYEEDGNETEYLLANEVNKQRLLQAVDNVTKGEHLKEYTMQEINRFLNEPNG